MKNPKNSLHTTETMDSGLSSGVIKVGTFGSLANVATKVEKPKNLLKAASKKTPKHSEKLMPNAKVKT